jgi:hypothetical protein
MNLAAPGPARGTYDAFVLLFGAQLAHESALATATHQAFDVAAAARERAESFAAINGQADDVGAVDRIATAALRAYEALDHPPSHRGKRVTRCIYLDICPCVKPCINAQVFQARMCTRTAQDE